MKGDLGLSIRAVTMIVLGIMIVVLIYVSFDTVVNSLIESFLDNISIPEVD